MSTLLLITCEGETWAKQIGDSEEHVWNAVATDLFGTHDDLDDAAKEEVSRVLAVLQAEGEFHFEDGMLELRSGGVRP